MKKPKFIFGGTSGVSYDQLQRQRKIAEQLVGQNSSTPRNAGEGIAAIGRALAARSLNKKADKTLQDNPQLANMQGLIDVAGKNPSAAIIKALMNGAPNFKRGGTSKGGVAVVGEGGPELVKLPRGAQVLPASYDEGGPASNPNRANEIQQELDNLSPEELQRIQEYDQNSQKRLLQQPEELGPSPVDMREMIPQQESRFDDAAAYKTADMTGVKPSGVGETNQLNATARSFQGIMKSLDQYENIYKDGGSTMLPGARKDTLDTAHRDLQMTMKELYNLGVLNGPDLELMNQILLSPTSIGGNIMDTVGIADMDERILSNIGDVRRMMTDRATPALQQLGIDPASLMPPKELSDDEYLKSLGLE